LDALENAKIPVRQDYISHVKGFSHNDGLKPTKKLLKSSDLPDAIFAMNDNIAISAMHIARKMGMSIPEDISIVGFDDEPHSSYFRPSLSTVWQPVYSIGMLAARIVLGRLNSNNADNLAFREEVFKPELVVRESSKPFNVSA
jgi:LacI family transcriptional regulator